MVFQNHALFPHMTVLENVGFGLRMRGTPRADAVESAREALRLVRLEGFEDRYPRELSGGQQQRVGIARALAVKPKVLLMDEPLSSLDAKLRREMQVELRRIQKSVGITALYVTHDQEEALSLSDRVVLMNRGRIEQSGTPEEMYARPATRFAAGFIGESNFLEAVLDEVRGGEARIMLATGERIMAAAPPSVSSGGKVHLAVRPSRLRPATASDAGALTGKIVASAFVGSHQRLVVRLADDSEMLMIVEATDRLPAPDETISIAAAPADWMVFPSEARE
jgi:ABC-type Fe3+/spermidine/putrescine transport system ATPase subunit